MQMLDTTGPENLADMLGPKDMAQLLIDTLKQGEILTKWGAKQHLQQQQAWQQW